jgi:hypothetical protein
MIVFMQKSFREIEFRFDFHARRGGGVAISLKVPRWNCAADGRSRGFGSTAGSAIAAGSVAAAVHPAAQQGLPSG